MIRKENGVWTYLDGREVCQKGVAGNREYKRRIEEMRERQECHCAICSRTIAIGTFDHQSGRGNSGSNRDDRIEIYGKWHNAALCYGCNSDKGSKRYHWLDGSYVQNYGKQSVYETPDAGPEPWVIELCELCLADIRDCVCRM